MLFRFGRINILSLIDPAVIHIYYFIVKVGKFTLKIVFIESDELNLNFILYSKP